MSCCLFFVQENGFKQRTSENNVPDTANVILFFGNCKAIVDLPL